MPLRLLRDYLRCRRLTRAGIVPQLCVPTFQAGARSGVWTVCTDGLDAQSVVYSAGVGDNVAWDLAMIERFGVTVHAFDPTPRSVAWVAKQDLPSRFVFHPVGLADGDGLGRFRAPSRPGNCNYLSCPDGDGAVEAPVRRLRTLLGQLGHDHLDILKLDIEGAEYCVLADLLASGIQVRQLLVEFHHNVRGFTFEQTRQAIRSLQDRGYRLFHVSRRGLEFAFLLDGQPFPVYR